MVGKVVDAGAHPSDSTYASTDADAVALFPAVLELVIASVKDCQPQLRLVCHAARNAVDKTVDSVRARTLPADAGRWAALPRLKHLELSLMPGLADELCGSIEFPAFLDIQTTQRLVKLPLPELTALALAPLAVDALPLLADASWPKLEELVVHSGVAITDESAFEEGLEPASFLADVGGRISDAFGLLERSKWPLKRLNFTMFPLAPGMEVPVPGLAEAAASFKGLSALHLSAALTTADVEMLTGTDLLELRDLKIDFQGGQGGRGCLEAVAAAVAAGRWSRLKHLELSGVELVPLEDAPDVPFEALARLKTLKLACNAGSEDAWIRVFQGLDGGALRILDIKYKGTFDCLNGFKAVNLPKLIILTAAYYDDGQQGAIADGPLSAIFSAQLPELRTMTLRYRDTYTRSILSWSEPPALPADPTLPLMTYLQLENIKVEDALPFLGRVLPRKCILNDCATRSEPMFSRLGEEPTPEDLVWEEDAGALEGNSDDEDIDFVAFKSPIEPI